MIRTLILLILFFVPTQDCIADEVVSENYVSFCEFVDLCDDQIRVNIKSSSDDVFLKVTIRNDSDQTLNLDKRVIGYESEQSSNGLILDCEVGNAKYVGSITDYGFDKNAGIEVRQGEKIEFDLKLKDDIFIEEGASNCFVIYSFATRDVKSGKKYFLNSNKLLLK